MREKKRNLIPFGLKQLVKSDTKKEQQGCFDHANMYTFTARCTGELKRQDSWFALPGRCHPKSLGLWHNSLSLGCKMEIRVAQGEMPGGMLFPLL